MFKVLFILIGASLPLRLIPLWCKVLKFWITIFRMNTLVCQNVMLLYIKFSTLILISL